MPPARRPNALPALLTLMLLVLPASHAAARVAASATSARTPNLPRAIAPAEGARLEEGDARLEVEPGVGLTDLRVVVSKTKFDASGWVSLPTGDAWTVLPFEGAPLRLAPLALARGGEASLWWTLVWSDPSSGRLRTSDVRRFTLVPSFSNRAAARGELPLSAAGRLPSPPPADPLAPRRSIELAAGAVLQPGVTPTLLPSFALRAAEGGAEAAGSRAPFIVQFADDDPDSARARLAHAGGALLAPLSNGAWLARLDEQALARLQAAGGEPWITAYEPSHKLSRAFQDSTTGPVRATALVFEDGDGDAALAALRSLGAARLERHRSRRNDLIRFELDRGRLAEAAALEDLAWIEPTPVYSFQNDSAQWVVQSSVLNARPVTDHGIRGQGQIVMTSDSGIRTNHEMFNDTTLAISTWGDYPSHRKIVAYQPSPAPDPVDFGDAVAFDYHGTHTAGTVAGDPSATSSARWSGMAPDAKLYFMDVGSSAGGGLSLPADLNDIFEPSYLGNAAGVARVSSNSWGAVLFGTYTLASMQADQFVWDHPDYLIAFSSGNYGTFGAVSSPATAKNVLTVGATGNGESRNKFAPFSSRGPAKDGRRKPTVMAPGVGVASSIGATRYSYAAYSGTSMATPAVAGAMALVRQYLVDGWYPSGAPVAGHGFVPSAALLRAMAVAAARNDVTGYRAPDNTIGYGRLTIDDVLYFPGDSLRTLLVDATDDLEHGSFVEYPVHVTDPTQPLKIALVWTDAPGNPAAAVQLVNDLDLVVTHAGVSWFGNALLNNISVPNGPKDTLNVEEFVRLPAPEPGLYTVRIEARRIAQGPQRFALCITGGVGGAMASVALDQFEYGLTDTLEIEVVDPDAAGTLTALVSSDTEQGNELVTLTGGQGIYRGRLPLDPGAAVHGDGRLAVTTGDQIRVSYQDAPPADPLVTTARIRVQAPVIRDVHAVALGAHQVLVRWNTDRPATSRVRFSAGGPLQTVTDSAGHSTSHAVLLRGLEPRTTYRYDVESVSADGDVSRDSLGGEHRAFTTRPAGTLALLMDDPSASVLETWNNAFQALGWDVDIYPAAMNDPPLVGDRTAGLRSYDAVMWQLDPDRYPPLTDAQRTAVDSLLEGGGRLLLTGHDIGFGLSDAGAPSYTPEREAWLESSLKSRYYIDNLYADTLTGVAGDPVSGAYADSLYITWYMYPDTGDNFGPAPGTDGVWTGVWTENYFKKHFMGMRWESHLPLGVPGSGVWGGEKTRLVCMFHEWRALGGPSTAHLPDRTGALHDAVAWLVGHRPPQARITSPKAGSTLSYHFLPVWFSASLDAGRAVATRELEYSLDGGESWAPAPVAAWNDSMAVWDLASANGGPPVGNSARAMLRLHITDDGSPPLRTVATTGTFTLTRWSGDTRGPALIAGSASCSPAPLRPDRAATLFATFSDAETGAARVTAAEYSIGPEPAAPGAGTRMTGNFEQVTVQAQAELATEGLPAGTLTIWVRGLDENSNWSEASAIGVMNSAAGTGASALDAEQAVKVDFLGPVTPNPFRGRATLRFGLAREGDVKLELFDVSGRVIRTLANGRHSPGVHVLTWDGHDREGNVAPAGIYFLRLHTPTRTFRSRVVSLR